MSKRWRVWGSLAALSLLILGAVTPAVAISGGAVGSQAVRPVPVQILAINDFHGQLGPGRTVDGRPVGSAPVLAAYLKAREALLPQGTLLVHAGDAVGASPPISALLQDEPTIEFLNYMGFDVGTVGNHEFDEGVAELLRLVRGGRHPKTGYFPGAAFPYTVANVVDAETGDPILPPYVVKAVNGVRLGFIGVVTPETPTIVTPTGVAGLAFLDPAEAVNRWVPELKRQGVRAIVVLAHLGNDPAVPDEIVGPVADLARLVDDEVDIIISGHTHSYIDGWVDGKLIVQAYSYGTAFADVDLTVDPITGDVLVATAEVVTTWADEVTPDPGVQALVDGYQEKVAPLVERQVAVAETPITREASPAGESALGNLIADAQRWKMGTDFAFMNPGGIRADLDAGPITWGELYAVQPFGNDLVKMTLTGEQIYRLLNQQWQEGRTRFLQISGLTYTYDESRPWGDRILEVRLPDGRPIDREARYTVTVNSFLAAGGDNFTVLTEGTDRVVGPVDLDALVEYLEQMGGPVTAQIEGRIQKVGGGN
ncbi:MAG: 5'-nucleotidase C-terminal domain-containing protein [Bacillota bacterium]|nr:MAG: bifunctional metallophosphatase/5'-nucleotidase [Bacillota bacterium]